MISTFIYSIASVLVVSIVSLIGAFTLSIKEAVLRKYIFLLVSLAVGALLGDAFIHLIPEAFEAGANPMYVSLAIIGGIVLFFVIEKFLHWHHHAAGEHDHETIHPTGKMILISDGVHNLIDGLIIGASFLVGTEVGIATTVAVILHEIPQEIGDFGVLLHSGLSKAKALWFNFVSALAAVVGTIIALVIGGTSDFLTIWLIPIAAGGFIYIALSDLIPELHKTKQPHHSLMQFAAVMAGILAMLLLLAVE
jgi:zinc and cadmium transporter